MTIDKLSEIDAKLDELLNLERMNAKNIFALYRRSVMLAHMVESIADGREPHVPKIMRAEIDASMDPEAFETLSYEDSDEFIRRYGRMVLDILRKQGIDMIVKMGDFAPLKATKGMH